MKIPEVTKDEVVHKVLVVGDAGAGKTSIIRRYVNNEYSEHYKATVGVDFALKVVKWDDDSVVRLQLWDIGGQERFSNMTRIYYKEAVGAFIVFDITDVNSFDSVQKWKSDVDAKVSLPNNRPIHVVLLANKSDLLQKQSIFHKEREKMDAFCAENGFIGWFETSAALGIGIDEASKCLLSKIVASTKPVEKKEGITVTKRPPRQEEKDTGCC